MRQIYNDRRDEIGEAEESDPQYFGRVAELNEIKIILTLSCKKVCLRTRIRGR